MIHNHPLAVPERPFFVYLTDNINAVGDLASDTARTLWDGLCEEVVAQNCDLLAVIGGGYREDFRSMVYDLVTPESAEGFISWIVEGGPGANDYFARFVTSRLVSLSRRYSHHPVVEVANRAGMQAMTRHLVLQHGRRAIGFVRGPEHHPYAEERFESYRETLIELGMVPDDRREAPQGSWDRQTGIDGVCYLLDRQGLKAGRDLDAIMCASDRIAMGVLDELKRRHIRIPEDIAVTGYNNLLEAQSHIPALTTVAVPFQRKSHCAVRMLLASLKGESYSPDPDYLDPVVIIGESCGCQNHRLHDIQLSPGTGGASTQVFTEVEIARHCEEAEAICRAFRTASATGVEASRLTRAFAASVESMNFDGFLALLQKQIQSGHYALMDQVRWQDVLTVLRKMVGVHPRCPQDMERVETILDRARLMVMDSFARTQTSYRLKELREASLLRQLGASLGLSSDVSTVMDTLARELPRLGISSCWLSVFDGSGAPDALCAPIHSRLLLAIEGGRRSTLPEHGVRFESRQLVPEGFLLQHQRRTFILFPLAHGDEEYGFVIFEHQADDGVIYEALAFSIGGALKGAFMRDELEKRTLELEFSIYELGRARNKLVETEKLAALGELVAGIAHEINTPVGIGVTAVSTMAESVKRLRIALEARSARAIRDETDMLEEGADIALRNLHRANELIESFKQIAVDQSYEERRAFELGAYLQDIVRSLEPRLRPDHHEVRIDCPEPVMLDGFPGALSQVISNLVLNSVIHGFEARKHGQIDMICRRAAGMVEIEYLDNGIGMETVVLEKIFHPFFTTKRGQGGTGLGMNIAYNLTTQRLLGTIECESVLGQGVRFMIRIPLVV